MLGFRAQAPGGPQRGWHWQGLHQPSKVKHMNFLSQKSLALSGSALVLLSLGACSGMSARQQDTAVGAGVGAVGGAILSGGSGIGTVGGAAVGAVIGNEVGKDKR